MDDKIRHPWLTQRHIKYTGELLDQIEELAKYGQKPTYEALLNIVFGFQARDLYGTGKLFNDIYERSNQEGVSEISNYYTLYVIKK